MSNLLRMVYVSTSTNPINTTDGNVHKDIGRILMQSRKNNPKQTLKEKTSLAMMWVFSLLF